MSKDRVDQNCNANGTRDMRKHVRASPAKTYTELVRVNTVDEPRPKQHNNGDRQRARREKTRDSNFLNIVVKTTNDLGHRHVVRHVGRKRTATKQRICHD